MSKKRSHRPATAAAPPRPAVTADAFAAAATRLAAQRPLRHPRLLQIAANLQNQLVLLAAQDLDDFLARHPDDPDALSLKARIAVRQGQRAEARALLRSALKKAPGFAAARYNLAHLLLQDNQYRDALTELDLLLAHDSRNPMFRLMKANTLELVGENDQALALCQALAAEYPQRPDTWIRLGHALRAAGRSAESIAAYRQAIAWRPGSGAAYWSLANLRTLRFDDADVAAMQAQLRHGQMDADDRVQLQFALAKALEDRGEHAASFQHYAEGNASMRQRISYDPDMLSRAVTANKALYTTAFLAARRGQGCPSPDPIFILGRPRSGSTLVEQILSSHSAVEGTAELPYITALANELVPGHHSGPAYNVAGLDALARMDASALRALGERYLASAQAHRQQGRPFFIDKKPANFLHVGMIHLMLPQAKIIDVRRHPGASGWSMFKSYSSKGRLRLDELGRYYRDYVELMAHFDTVMPGRVHRVIYEDLVAQPEAEIRRLLAYLGLDFEAQCLRFHETERTVLTPSSEQVRQPLNTAAVDHWRHYEPWLGPLFDGLGAVGTAYPQVPEAFTTPRQRAPGPA